MTNEKRNVKAEASKNGYLIFKLIEGTLKIRTVTTFGYSARNKLWVRIVELDDSKTAIVPEDAVDAKAEIAAWSR